MKKIALIVAISMIVLVGTVKAFDVYGGVTMNNVTFENAFFGMGTGDNTGGGVLGSDGDSNFTNLVAEGDITAGDALTVAGLSTLSGGVATDVGSIAATTTLTSASENVQLLKTSAVMTTITLPAATDGLSFKFVVVGALTGSLVLIDSKEGDNIEGAMMVNDAWVVCAGEDQINIITDGELVGDQVELISDGTSWYIIDSEVDASGKFTCTDPS